MVKNLHGLTDQQIYNADEAALFLKLLLAQTWALHQEKVAEGKKVNKTRLTFMPCSNKTGDNKLRLMIIGHSAKPRCFPKDTSNLPFFYRSNKTAWQTRKSFQEWFHEEFVPSVREFSRLQNIEPKALLLLDNCSAHHSGGEELKSDDGLIFCYFLPPNVTSLCE
jgi:DDE superfamily endonuclease